MHKHGTSVTNSGRKGFLKLGKKRRKKKRADTESAMPQVQFPHSCRRYINTFCIDPNVHAGVCLKIKEGGFYPGEQECMG